MFEILEDFDSEVEYLFVFEINNCMGESVIKKLNVLLVDCGVIIYIINDEFKFSNFDDKFVLEKYYIELVDGIWFNNVVFKRGDVEIIIMDIIGKCVNVILKNVLYIFMYF